MTETPGQILDSDDWAIARAAALRRKGELVAFKMRELGPKVWSIHIVRADGTEERRCVECDGRGGVLITRTAAAPRLRLAHLQEEAQYRYDCVACGGTGTERLT